MKEWILSSRPVGSLPPPIGEKGVSVRITFKAKGTILSNSLTNALFQARASSLDAASHLACGYQLSIASGKGKVEQNLKTLNNWCSEEDCADFFFVFVSSKLFYSEIFVIRQWTANRVAAFARYNTSSIVVGFGLPKGTKIFHWVEANPRFLSSECSSLCEYGFNRLLA